MVSPKVRREISYGNTSNQDNIIDKLLVVDTYLDGVNLVVEMDDTFKAFESSEHNNYTKPGDFIFGLKDILSKVTKVESMTIKYNGKNGGVIHPDGYYIDNILLKD